MPVQRPLPEAPKGASLAPQSLTIDSLLVAVVGPTASGKTALGLELAHRRNGEIVSADSRQMYRRLDAGTDKPQGHWTEASGRRVFLSDGIPYHLVDVLDPSERIDASRFAEMARTAIAEARGRGKTPLLVGGTGLYLRALLEGLDPLPPRDPAIRERLAELAEANGRHWLHEELERVDPETAKRIPPNNLHRVVRALEVYQLTGKPISSLWSGKASDAAEASGTTTLYVGIQWERAALERRIRARCEAMFPRIVEETARLVPSEYSGREPGFQSLGYPEALQCLTGETTRERGLATFIQSTMAYAKRQATWFRKQTAVRWIPAGDGNPTAWADEIESMIA